MTGVVEIAWTAQTGGTGELTWSQRDMLAIMRELPGRHQHFNLTFPIELPAGTTADGVAAALRRLAAEHEALRTTVVDAEGDAPYQEVHTAGVIPMRVHHEQSPETVASWARRTPVGYPGEESVLADLIVAGGVPHTLVVTCSHLALDGFSVPVLRDQLLTLLAEPEAELPRAQSPRERAETERSPAGRAQSARNLAAIEKTLRAAGPSPFTPGRAPAGAAPFWWGRMRSRALHAALQVLSRRYDVPASAVLIAVAGQALVKGGPAFSVLVISANRFTAPLRRSLGCHFQPVPITVGVDPDFGVTARNAARLVTGAAMTGQFDPDDYTALMRRIEGETGRMLRPMPAFNIQDCGGGAHLEPAEIRALRAASTYERTGLYGFEDDGVYLNAVPRGDSLEVVVRSRVSMFPPAEGERLLAAVEETALALLDPEHPGTGPAPVFRDQPGIEFCSCGGHESDLSPAEESREHAAR